MSKMKKFGIVLLVLNILLLAAFGGIYAYIASVGRKYSSDSAKRMWDNDKYTYSQISLYLDDKNGLDDMDIYGLRKKVEEKLEDSSVLNAEDNPKGRLWIDCGSGDSSLSLISETGRCDVTVTGTFGDYFIFHPEKLIYGSYYTSDDVNSDRIIIDKECSWQLFGAVNTVGMPVTVDGKVCYVAAVTDVYTDEYDKYAYGSKPRAYIPYETLKWFNSGAKMTAYEVCIPNIVKDYAYTVVEEINPADEKSSAVVDQSGRFGLLTLAKGRKDIRKSVMSQSSMNYPWFENRVRGGEINARFLAAPGLFLLIIPALSLVYCIFMLVKLAGRGVRAVRQRAEKSYQKKISAEYYKKRGMPYKQ
ncbi:MAG: ABC transporter permease [Ruminococcus sp.]|nr:ABC transporter permease [Ruminococcus sp.]